MHKRSKFHETPIVRAVAALCVGLGLAQAAQAGPGFGDAYDLNNVPFIIPTFFASSPSGARLWDPAAQAPVGYDPANQAAYAAAVSALYPNGYPGTGKALRKFVDPLPLPGKVQTLADGVTQKYIPVAVKSKWVDPAGRLTNDDYYELAVVEYAEKFHSDLRKPTTLRGYVQIDHLATNGLGELPGSRKVPLTYPDGTPILVAKTDANGKLLRDAGGNLVKTQALAVDSPHYLGPVITATSTTSASGAPTRIKLINLLPVGRAITQAGTRKEWDPGTGTWADVPGDTVLQRRGDLFLPLDPSIAGAGYGPDGQHTYPQNRAMIHLHGGDNPWISDGTPHQWITPAGELDPALAGSVASDGTLDPTLVAHFTRGVGAVNVPDMNDPGPGAMTYYFPNGQSARMEWYHDHTIGMTRLNVYAGMASAYLLTDDKEQELIASKVLPGPEATIPLVLQDKAFVPDDIALQDARWSTSAWGEPGDFWFPHVYETVQDPNQATNFNAVGRWHWGPWFWPSFPAAYALPSGAYGDVTTTPEAWMDTPVVNGVAYPTLTVEPKPYRFRILNASNDRTFTFNLFEADPGVTSDDGRNGTEVKMIPIQTWTNLCAAGVTKSDGSCTPETWTTDIYGHAGGVPDPATQGPTLYQVASEGGFLPGVAKKDATPISYLLDKGRAAVLNVDYGMSGLHIGNGERADVVIDFSKYAGKTLLVYNDSGAPVPAADPRNEYFTGYGDNSATGGAEDTRAGYGPNTRTVMQIKVAPAVATPGIAPIEGNAVAEAALDTQIKSAYRAVQETPVVAQSAYNGALGTSWTDNQSFANIYTGSLKQPSFSFVPGTAGAVFNSVKLSNSGSGYLRPPVVTLDAPATGSDRATARASLKIDRLHVISGGSGYKVAPIVTITSSGQGSGASATATLKVGAVLMSAGGAGYTTAPTVTFSKPTTAGGVQATGTAIVSGGVVTGVQIVNAGAGYSTAPTVSFSGGGGTGAKATTTGSVDALKLDIPDPLNPGSAGGGGYTDLSTTATEPGNPAPGLIIGFTAPPAGGTAPRAGASGKVFDITLVNAGSGYTAPPGVTIGAPVDNPVLSALPAPDTVAYATALAATDTANGGTPQGSILVKTKAIQELFDPTYGRLNATFGVEIPYTSALTQTTIPLGYVDTPTEEFAAGETQIWKITHNGVDTHPIHFHLMNVQLINRVGWDNFVTPPEPNELGWKETIKMSPLEDVIVAVRPKRPKLGGFGLPLSRRLMDPSQPEGALTGFTQIDPNTGTPATMTNAELDFGWEYVWHCHILGHEENDFMRPVIFRANEAVPLAPTLQSATGSAQGVKLVWADNASTEFRFDIQRADVLPDGSTLGAFTTLGTALANAAEYLDDTATSATNASGGNAYAYQVVAVGASGSAASGVVTAPLEGGAPAAPTNLAAVGQSGAQIALTWTDVALNESGYVLVRTVGGVASSVTLPQNTTSYVDTGLPADTLVNYQLHATNASGDSPVVAVSAYTLGAPALTSLAATANSPTQVTLAWSTAATVRAQAVTGYSITRSGGAGLVTFSAAANATGYVDTTALQNTAYTYTVNAVNASGVAPVAGPASSAGVTTPYAAAGTLTGVSAVANSASLVTVSWTGGVPATQYLVERCTATAANFNCTAATSVWLPAVTVNAPATSYADAGVVANTTYAYRVTAKNGPNASNTVTTTVSTPPALLVNPPSNLTATVSFAFNNVALTWTDNATNETAFVIERSTDGVNFSQVGTAAPRTGTTGQTRNFTDTAVATGTTYWYRVMAQNVTGAVVTNSAPSNVVKVDYFLAAPASLTATIAGTTRVTLAWVDTTSAETSFAVWRSDNGAAPVQIGTVNRTAAQALATGGAVTFNNNNGLAAPLQLGHSYAYYVTAANGGVVSAASNTATVDFSAPAVPATPSATVTVTSATRADVALAWQAVAGATSYTLQRISPTGNVSTLANNTTALSFTDPGVRRNATTPYTYQVRANGAAGSSAYAPVSVLVN